LLESVECGFEEISNKYYFSNLSVENDISSGAYLSNLSVENDISSGAYIKILKNRQRFLLRP
jgi:hypothetical protein